MALLLVIAAIPGAQAAANLAVTAFTCSPSEVKVNDQFSCSATVENNGDAAGTLTTATLYPSGSWMESSSYAQTVNANINSGATTSVTFSGLKGTVTGNNGFARIMLDDVTDTYPADNNVKVNVINIAITVTQTADSAGAATSTVSATGQATAGGNVDIVLTFSVTSGGCGIGSQSSTASASDLTDGQTTANSWTVTMGTTANCVYSISAAATSNPSGTATKTDSSSKTITCTNCTSGNSDSGSSTSAGGGGGGGGGVTQCSDGLDNDNDGLIDLKDPDCESANDNREKPLPSCKQNWDCTGWSQCTDGQQTRTCTEKNDCFEKKRTGTAGKIIETPKPAETQECKSGIGGVIEAIKDAPKKLIRALTPESPLEIVAMAIVIIAGAGAVLYLVYPKYYKAKVAKKKEE